MSGVAKAWNWNVLFSLNMLALQAVQFDQATDRLPREERTRLMDRIQDLEETLENEGLGRDHFAGLYEDLKVLAEQDPPRSLNQRGSAYWIDQIDLTNPEATLYALRRLNWESDKPPQYSRAEIAYLRAQCWSRLGCREVAKLLADTAVKLEPTNLRYLTLSLCCWARSSTEAYDRDPIRRYLQGPP